MDHQENIRKTSLTFLRKKRWKHYMISLSLLSITKPKKRRIGVYGKMAEMAQTYQISRAFLDQLIWVAQHHLQDLFSPRLARRHHELTQYQHRARKARL
jgi:hypothetical protein